MTAAEIDALRIAIAQGRGLYLHRPEVTKGKPGHWQVICLACSMLAQDYVYPCTVKPGPEWPPATLVEPT